MSATATANDANFEEVNEESTTTKEKLDSARSKISEGMHNLGNRIGSFGLCVFDTVLFRRGLRKAVDELKANLEALTAKMDDIEAKSATAQAEIIRLHEFRTGAMSDVEYILEMIKEDDVDGAKSALSELYVELKKAETEGYRTHVMREANAETSESVVEE